MFREQDAARPAKVAAPRKAEPANARDQLRAVQDEDRQIKRQKAERASAVKAARTDSGRKQARGDAPRKGTAKKRR